MQAASESNPQIQPTDRETQRNALRDLVALATQSAATEADIERQHQSGVEQAKKEFEKGNWEVEQRYKALHESIDQKSQQKFSRIEEVYTGEMKGLRASDEASRRRIEHEYSTVERDIKQKFEQASWLAESVYDGTQAQLAEERKKAREEFGSRNDLLDTVGTEARNLIHNYRQDVPASVVGRGLETVIEPDQADAAFGAHRESAERHLNELRSLFVPELFAGIRPVLWVLVIGLLCAGATYVAIGQSKPPHIVIGIAAGATLALSLFVLIPLFFVGKSQVRQIHAKLSESLEFARAAAEKHLEHVKATQEKTLAEAILKRDGETQAAKEKLSPVLGQAAKRRDAAKQMFQVESARQAALTDERHSKQRAELEGWKQQHHADAKKKYELELERVAQRFEQRKSENERAYTEARGALAGRLHEGLTGIQSPIGKTNGRSPHDWADPQWSTWTPPRSFASHVSFGQLHVDLRSIADAVTQNGKRKLALPEAFSVITSLAFPKQASLLIHADDLAGRETAIRTLQMIMTRLLTSLPAGRVRFTIFDPVGLGQNFAGFMHLADHDEALVGGRIWTDREQIEQRLTDLTEHMETVIQKYLRNEFETIDDYNAQAGELAEPYRFLVVADFPVGFESEAFRRLSSIASTGARCGVYTLILRDTRQELPLGTTLADLEATSLNLVQQGERFVWRDDVFQQFPLTLDSPPSEEALTKILDVVGRHAKEAKRVEVPFDTIAPSEGQMWTRSSSEDLSVPVGRMGATRLQSLRLGRGVAQHVLIAGKTGSGKSTLLHALVTNLAMWYSPEEIEFYLVDFKKGVEFKTYATNRLPHARAIAVESDREFGLSVLQRLDAELTRRGDLFRKTGVQDLAGYRQTPDAIVMPRTLLIIDEFQEFFSEDDKLAQDAAILLDRLVRQGRAFGVHVLLGSQTIGGSSGLSRSTIGQMAVRVALQTSEADSQLILGDGNSAARLLTRPGEAIYNDAGGLVEANSPFQVAWLPDERRDEYLTRVTQLAERRSMNRPDPVIFEGNAPADISRNRRLEALLSQPPESKPPGQTWAYVGEPVAIKEPSGIGFRRQSGSNAIIIGQQDEGAMAIMLSSIVSLAAQHVLQGARFVVLDGTPADSPLAGMFARLKDVVPHELNLVDYRAVPETIAQLAAEFGRREQSDQSDFPSIYVFIYALQRYRALRKAEDDFSFSSSSEDKGANTAKQFADLLREGPGVGIHVIAWADTPATIERTFDRNAMREFDHRVLFQMSAADSSNLIDSPAANKLGMHRALAFSEEQGVMEKFRPYALPSRPWLDWVAQSLRQIRGV